MTEITERIHALREKIALAREVEARSTDQGLSANVRLYIAELEFEIRQLEAEIAADTPEKSALDEADST